MIISLHYILFFFLSIFLTYILGRFATKIGLVDSPNHRKIHKGDVPLVGGINIIILLLLSMYFSNYDFLILIIICLSILLFFLGLIDDKFTISPFIKLFFLICIVLVLIGFDFKILNYFNEIKSLNFILLSISPLITVLAIVGMTNAFNFIDGIDGLCSGLFLITLSSLYVLLIFAGYNINELEILNFLFFIVLGFFIVNINLLNIGKFFLGDSGSLMLGFFISTLFIYYTSFSEIKIEPTKILWCSTLVIFDFFAVFLKRIFNRLNPFKPDNTHIHHLLLNYGFSHNKILIFLLIISTLINAIGLSFDYYFNEVLSVCFFIFVFFIYFFFLKKIF